jgi:hypothetical protein
MDDLKFNEAKKRLCDELAVGIDAFKVLANERKPLSLRKWMGLFQRERGPRFDSGGRKGGHGHLESSPG